MTVTSKLVLQWLPLPLRPKPGWPAVSILWPCETASWISDSTSISGWQHVKLSKQIRTWVTLGCLDVKQPRNKPYQPSCPVYSRSHLSLSFWLSLIPSERPPFQVPVWQERWQWQAAAWNWNLVAAQIKQLSLASSLLPRLSVCTSSSVA